MGVDRASAKYERWSADDNNDGSVSLGIILELEDRCDSCCASIGYTSGTFGRQEFFLLFDGNLNLAKILLLLLEVSFENAFDEEEELVGTVLYIVMAL
jgi:hypothetical protein